MAGVLDRAYQSLVSRGFTRPLDERVKCHHFIGVTKIAADPFVRLC
jgi:hypothetical protein